MNNNFTLFENFLISDRSYVSISDLLINTILIIIFSIILKKTYLTCTNSFTDKEKFSRNFILLSFTTMLIIMIVKSSLALSLGLIGALSIIRFRTAIKEPEELTYLFLNISIGLGLGANQQAFTIAGFAIVIAIIWIRYFFNKEKPNKNLFFTIKNGNLDKIKLDDITKIIIDNSMIVNIKRFDENNNSFEITFNVGMTDFENIVKCRKEILQLDNSISISFVDNNL